MVRVSDGAKRAASADVIEARPEVQRARLRHAARILREAMRASRNAGYSRLPLVLADQAHLIEELLDMLPLPAPAAIDAIIDRAERTDCVWHGLATF